MTDRPGAAEIQRLETETIEHHRFDNGLTLVAQSMPWLESAAFSIAVPAGCRYDAANKVGTANFVCEMVQRGCGQLDSRQFLEALQMLGVDYYSSVSNHHSHFGGALKATQLLETLSIYRDVVRAPVMPADQIEDARQVCIQEIMSLEDDLSKQAMLSSRLRFYGDPDGRHGDGTLETIAAINAEDLQNYYQRHYQSDGTIIAVAGKIDFERLRDHVAELFGDWKPDPAALIKSSATERGSLHIPFESDQTHIAISMPGVSARHDDYWQWRAAIGVLSDGMSSRLFREVREKRGLCYTVYASCHSVLDRGGVFAYAGTSSGRAQETLDVLLEEIGRLSDGISSEELRRLKVQLRSDLVMQQESCRSRVGSIFSNWFNLGRVRTIDEINTIITKLECDPINAYLKDNPPANFDVVTLGSAALEMKHAV